MGRFLFLLLLAALAVWQLGRLVKRFTGKDKGAARVADNKTSSERMVACSYCGLNVPESESFSARGTWYCSEQHLQLGDKGSQSDQ